MLRNHFARAIDGLLNFLLQIRLSLCRDGIPADLELLQCGGEYGVIGPVAVALDGRGGGVDFSTQCLSLTGLSLQHIALAGQDFVDTFVVTAANCLDELPQLAGVLDSLGGLLPYLGGGAPDNQPAEGRGISSGQRRFEFPFLLCGNHGTIRRARLRTRRRDAFRYFFRRERRWRRFAKKTRKQRHQEPLQIESTEAEAAYSTYSDATAALHPKRLGAQVPQDLKSSHL